jgi:hypothetical protein
MVDGMYAVKPRLAEVLSRFDLGEKGLTPFTIFQEDLKTPLDDEFWLLNLSVRKDTFLPDKSNQEGFRIRKLAIDPETGLPMWKVSSLAKDGDVTVSTKALEGADLWVEERVWGKLFMSDALVEAPNTEKLKKVDFSLQRCSVVEG